MWRRGVTASMAREVWSAFFVRRACASLRQRRSHTDYAAAQDLCGSSGQGMAMARQLKVAVQMDPIDAINIDADSTFALMLEAQQRGHAMWHYEVRNMAL